jgi:hypothetical protein
MRQSAGEQARVGGEKKRRKEENARRKEGKKRKRKGKRKRKKKRKKKEMENSNFPDKIFHIVFFQRLRTRFQSRKFL